MRCNITLNDKFYKFCSEKEKELREACDKGFCGRAWDPSSRMQGKKKELEWRLRGDQKSSESVYRALRTCFSRKLDGNPFTSNHNRRQGKETHTLSFVPSP